MGRRVNANVMIPFSTVYPLDDAPLPAPLVVCYEEEVRKKRGILSTAAPPGVKAAWGAARKMNCYYPWSFRGPSPGDTSVEESSFGARETQVNTHYKKALAIIGSGLVAALCDPAAAQSVAVATGTAGKVHLLPATMETTQLGWYDNAQRPVLTINPGDTVVMETMMHFHDRLVPGGATLDDLAKVRQDNPGRGAHTLTGPIYVEGAEPGDVLKVKINKIVPRSYGVNMNYPGFAGQFPKDFPDGRMRFVYLDWDNKVAEFLPGVFIPLRPFPGVLGVARAEPGRYSTVPPGRYGGNMDIRELTVGSTLYVPVLLKGALLWASDAHAAQGNGEVNLTGIETAFREFNITVDVVKGRSLEWPRIETPTHWLTLGYDQDLNKALDILKSETAKFITEQQRVTAVDAQRMMMQGWDCRISEVVDIVKGTFCFNPKDTRTRPPAALPGKETATDYVTVASNADLNKAMDDASMAMIKLLSETRKLDRLDAYALASVAMDCRIAPPAGTEAAVHCLVPKSLWRTQARVP
jgi:acetamidase/formamidase